MPHAPRAPVLSDDRSRHRQMLATFDERWPGARRRVGGLALALLVEAGLFLAILTLGQASAGRRDASETLTTVDFAPEQEPAPPPPEPDAAAKPTALPRAVPAPRPDQPSPITPPIALPPPAAIIPLSKNEVPTASVPRIKAVVRDDAQGPMGPPNIPRSGDSQRVGSTASGEPVYAARWYREPTDDELRGYLSTASGPGWAIITCKTVSDFRVEDCVLEDEYPSGAQIGRAVMAAAWQFKVRPPQIGGRSLVGEWVRIKITYDVRRG